ncbi:hypothetical protein [Cecembia calidifontis]|jgi:hypothetical protein|uniref:Uncharacterized protein n=1 Tax=Cecembia calidifontis TaxID=1187080 RepID=A0A4Q7P7S5_9BACT|nr:hypothetical protein [Cecembia calidifontis]RZS96105.1 hypothetical protein BC751_1662 [Cecembia calidifontis]
MKTTTFRFPKTVMAIAGAAALVVTTGFISSEATEVVEEAEELFVEMEEEAFLGTTYRDLQCGARGGNCLPTFCCVTPPKE